MKLRGYHLGGDTTKKIHKTSQERPKSAPVNGSKTTKKQQMASERNMPRKNYCEIFSLRKL